MKLYDDKPAPSLGRVRAVAADGSMPVSVDFAGRRTLGIPGYRSNLMRWHAAVAAPPRARTQARPAPTGPARAIAWKG